VPILESISCIGASKRFPRYSICQVQRLCRNGACLIMAEGNIYDATGFLDSHPAGAASIARKAGQDCTVDFGFHSVKARKGVWASLQIGTLVPCAVHGPSKDRSVCSVQ
jgi:cytochrome b involved in lipid metabolism